MYAVVIRAQGQPGKIDTAASIWRDSVIPVLKQRKGFKGGFFMTDPDTGKGISITFWETEADAKEGEASGLYKERIAKFTSVLTEPPTREVYEVQI